MLRIYGICNGLYKYVKTGPNSIPCGILASTPFKKTKLGSSRTSNKYYDKTFYCFCVPLKLSAFRLNINTFTKEDYNKP